MSNIAMQGGSTGSGTVTLLAPSTSTNRTLTLPDATGTVLTSATTTGFPAGSVLRVVQAVSTTFISTTSTSVITTGISASITPSSTSSKIYVLVTWTNQINSGGIANFSLYRGTVSGTDISNSRIGYPGTGNAQLIGSVNYLDSPSTTSSQTYTLGFYTNGTTCFISPGGEKGAITLMEIAA